MEESHAYAAPTELAPNATQHCGSLVARPGARSDQCKQEPPSHVCSSVRCHGADLWYETVLLLFGSLNTSSC